jgi:hypothetical protein
MSKKKESRRRRGFPRPMRKALSSALLAGAILVPTTQALGEEQSPDLTITQRVLRVREAISSRLSQDNPNLDEILSKLSYEESEVAQWGNWGNWNNWGNWGNWNNWNNWGNWGNWANQWGNWGNF